MSCFHDNRQWWLDIHTKLYSFETVSAVQVLNALNVIHIEASSICVNRWPDLENAFRHVSLDHEWLFRSPACMDCCKTQVTTNRQGLLVQTTTSLLLFIVVDRPNGVTSKGVFPILCGGWPLVTATDLLLWYMYTGLGYRKSVKLTIPSSKVTGQLLSWTSSSVPYI